MKTDRLRVRYDPGRVTQAQMLQVIDKKGYEAKAVSGQSP
ncbi:MAG: hypothetical protein L0Z62_01995 [Gemmataceae bacterium]|nr:hypothetical protein [Gemmataceae bacterium]